MRTYAELNIDERRSLIQMLGTEIKKGGRAKELCDILNALDIVVTIDNLTGVLFNEGLKPAEFMTFVSEDGPIFPTPNFYESGSVRPLR